LAERTEPRADRENGVRGGGGQGVKESSTATAPAVSDLKT